MAAKTPIRTVYTNNVATGLAEFQTGEFVDYGLGGTGLTALGTAGQVLKVNSGRSALEYGNVEAVLNIEGMTDGSGITIVDADKFVISDGGTEKYITASQLSTYITTEIGVNIDAYPDGTSVTLAGTDRLLVSDSGTEKMVNVSQIDTFVSGSTATLTNKTLTSPTINAGTLAAVTITGVANLTGAVLSGASPLVLEGATANAYETTLAVTDPTAARTITFQDATGTVAHLTDITGGGAGTFSTVNITSNIVFEGATADDYETTLAVTDPTADRTITFPNVTGTVSLIAGTETLTNKTIDLGSNTLTGSLAEFNAALQSESFVSLTGSETLTNKTLTSPVLNTGVSGSAIADEDNMSSNSATKLATQQSIKAYVDAQIATEDTIAELNDTTITGTPADNEVLAYDTSTSTWINQTPAEASLVSLTGSETLTNKTLASPIFTTNFTIGNATITEAELEVLDGASVTTSELNILDGVTATAAQLNYSNISTLGTSQASKVVTVDANGDLVVPDSDKFKFGAGSDMQIYHDGTNSYITNATGALKIATETSGIALTIGHTTSQVTIADNLTVAGNLTVTGTETIQNTVTMNAQNAIIFEGVTADDYETTLTIVDPTADRTVYMPNATGYLPLLNAASTTTITATPAELNYVDGVTSAIQTQMDTKASKAFSIAQAVALG